MLFLSLSFTRDRIDIVFQGGFGVRLGNISFFQGSTFFLFGSCIYIVIPCMCSDNFKT